jgi:uncharacterized protein YgiM (DUF1202 family)
MFGADLHKKEGYPLTDMNVREKATTKSKIIDKIQYKQKIEILDVVYDKEGQYWYHTKYGYMFGPSITTDVRFVKADLLHIRLKPTLQGKELSYFLDGDKVIVIKQAGKSDGYNWVLTTEGYVSSDYLTTALIKNIEHDKIPTKTIEFYEKPDKTLKPSQTIKKEEVEFIVKEAIKIDSSKSKEEIKKEQALAIKNNKIKSQIKKENIHSKSKSNLYALSKDDEIKEVYQLSVSSFNLYYGGEYNHFKREHDIGKKLSNTAKTFTINLAFSYTLYDKSVEVYTTFEKSEYDLRKKENFILGLKKYLKLTKEKRIYFILGAGKSKLIWKEDPLSGSVVQDKTSQNRLYEIGLGWEYEIASKLYFDFLLKESYANHYTELSYITQNDKVKDKFTTKYLLGLSYKF